MKIYTACKSALWRTKASIKILLKKKLEESKGGFSFSFLFFFLGGGVGGGIPCTFNLQCNHWPVSR